MVKLNIPMSDNVRVVFALKPGNGSLYITIWRQLLLTICLSVEISAHQLGMRVKNVLAESLNHVRANICALTL